MFGNLLLQARLTNRAGMVGMSCYIFSSKKSLKPHAANFSSLNTFSSPDAKGCPFFVDGQRRDVDLVLQAAGLAEISFKHLKPPPTDIFFGCLFITLQKIRFEVIRIGIICTTKWYDYIGCLQEIEIFVDAVIQAIFDCIYFI